MAEHFITDIHSHVLFGIDDGAKTVEESIDMLRLAESQGVKNIFCTSHHWSSKAINYERNFAILKERAAAEGIGINIFTGMETFCAGRYLSEVIEDIKSGTAKSLNDSDFQLLELFPDMSAEEIFSCVNAVFEKTDKKVILAHVERYEKLYGNSMMLACLKELGTLFQVNAYSLSGERNEAICSFARELLADKAVDFIGSDAHRIKHRPPKVADGVKYIYETCDRDYADAVCFANAERLILKN